MKGIILSLAFFSMACLQAKPLTDRADYVVVGIGTAGGLMAKKLSDDKKTSVIGLHSGKDFTGSFILKYSKNVPFSVTAAQIIPVDISATDLPLEVRNDFQALLDLNATTTKPLYESGATTPQVDLGGEELGWVLPLPLGGGSSINAGAWCRGTNQVYSQWEASAGPEWSVNIITDSYKRLEHYRGNTNNPNARGFNGPVKVIEQIPSKLSKVFTQAVVAATGFPAIADYNDPNTPIGVASTQVTHRGGGAEGIYRVSSATAFLGDDVMDSKGQGVNGRKLQINTSSTALRILWNGNTAIGVQYIQNGVVKNVYANKGVIVCAGLRSSQFLMSSGVGPASVLTPLGIPVVFDNPNVGQGLADQYQAGAVFASNPNDSAAGSTEVFSQLSWLPAPGGDPTSRQVRLATVDVIPGVTIMLVDLCQPLSRGSITINSADPLAPPVIDFGALSNPSDLNLYVSAYQTYVSAINTQLQAIDPQYQLISPAPEILSDTVLLEAYIESAVQSNMCFQSHCLMAPLGSGGVVDFSGRVYGVNNVIVADNSINPVPMDGTPMASGYLVALNIARMLGH